VKTVYFVRHGESEANVGHPIFQGETSNLTARGKEQARVIADRCKRLDFDILISSPTARARATAEHISSATGKPIVFEELFTERKIPSGLVGLPMKDPKADEVFKRWEQSLFDPNIRVEDSENFLDIKARAEQALKYLEGRRESRIVVVSHGFFLRTILARILFGEALSPQELKTIISTFRTSNTGLTLTQYEPEEATESWGIPQNSWVIRAWNDHAHLG